MSYTVRHIYDHIGVYSSAVKHLSQNVSEYDQEMPQIYTESQPTAP